MAATKAITTKSAGHSLAEAALNRMPQGICVWDRHLRLAFFNDAFRRMYQLRRSALRQGMTVLEVIEASAAAGNHPGRTAADVAAEYRSRISGTGRRRENSYERLRGDGSYARKLVTA